MSGNAKTRRANTMKLVHSVMTIGESIRTRNIMDRMIDAYGASHHHLPRSATALAAMLRGEHTMTKVVDFNRKYSWRRTK